MSWRPNGLARASVRSRPASSAGAFVALFFASAIVSAAALFLQTGVTAGAEPVRYAAAPVVVAAQDQLRTESGDGWTTTTQLPERPLVDADLADRLAALPEVGSVVADVDVPVSPAGAATVAATGPAWSGRGWASTALSGAGTPQDGGPQAGEVVLDRATATAAGLRAGDDVELTTPAGTAAFAVAGVLDVPAGEPAGPRVWFADAEAATLAGHPGEVAALAVLPAAGTSTAELAGAVRAAVADAPARPTGLVVATGEDRGRIEVAGLGLSLTVLTGLGGSLGGVLLLVAVFVVMSTTALAVEQRSRELALLRAVGATPRQLRRTVAAETGMVALLAAPLGLVPGLLLARWLLGAMADRGLLVEGLELSTGPLAFLATVAVVALAALAAGLLAARRPARVRPAEALRDAALAGNRIGPMRWVLGLLALAGSVPLAVVSATAPGDVGMGLSATIVLALLLAVALLGPPLAAAVSWAVQPLLHRFGVAGRLAAANGRTNTRRLASAITPLVLAVAFAGTMLILQGSVERATTVQTRDSLTADSVVSSTGAGLPADVPDALAALPGVQAAVGVLPTRVLAPSAGELVPYSAAGLAGDLGDLPQVLDAGVRDGDLTALRPGTGDDDGTVALDAALADSLDAGVGDRVELRAGDGTPLDLAVVAVYGRGLGVGSALLPYETVRDHVAAPVVGQVLVDGDADAAELTAAAGPATTVLDPAGAAAQRQVAGSSSTWLNNVVAGALAGFAAIAAANTLVMIALSRRREITLLGMVGATRGQLLGTARLEALVVAGTGLGLGGLIAWVTLQPSVRGATGSGPYLPWSLALGIAVGVLVLALVSTGLPTRALLRAGRAATPRE